MSDAPHVPAPSVPPGWYPDPSGAPAWRRWEGGGWGDATLPFRGSAPDAEHLFAERVAWRRLRPLVPLAIAVPALGAALMAADSPNYGPIRTWLRAAWHAARLGQPTPALPTTQLPATSPVVTLVQLAVLVLATLGIIAWLRYSASALRVAADAGYGGTHGGLASGLAFFVPLLGPFVAAAASRSCLPKGHEARRALGIGWSLVAAAEAAWLGLYATVVTTPDMTLTWAVAATCAALWLGAAAVLPEGLHAVADDHATLDVRPGAAYS